MVYWFEKNFHYMKRIRIIIAFFVVYVNCSAQVLNDNPLKPNWILSWTIRQNYI